MGSDSDVLQALTVSQILEMSCNNIAELLSHMSDYEPYPLHGYLLSNMHHGLNDWRYWVRKRTDA